MQQISGTVLLLIVVLVVVVLFLVGGCRLNCSAKSNYQSVGCVIGDVIDRKLPEFTAGDADIGFPSPAVGYSIPRYGDIVTELTAEKDVRSAVLVSNGKKVCDLQTDGKKIDMKSLPISADRFHFEEIFVVTPDGSVGTVIGHYLRYTKTRIVSQMRPSGLAKRLVIPSFFFGSPKKDFPDG